LIQVHSAIEAAMGKLANLVKRYAQSIQAADGGPIDIEQKNTHALFIRNGLRFSMVK